MDVKQLKGPDDQFDLQLPERQFDLVGFGLNAVDHLCVVPEFPRQDTKSEVIFCAKLGGGQVATVVAFAVRMGLKAKYIGKVGGDDAGRFSLSSMKDAGIDTSSVIVQHDATNQCAWIIIDQRSGERTILWHRDPRLDFCADELREEDVCCGRILHLDGHDPASLRAAVWANRKGIPVVIDLDKVVPWIGEIMANVDFLITNAAFPSEFTGITDFAEALLELRRFCPGFIASTLGAQGAAALVGDVCMRFPGYEIPAVDTTGAGDIFHGAFIFSLLMNWSLARTMDFSNAAAALSCTKIGARGGIPSLEEILQLMHSRK